MPDKNNSIKQIIEFRVEKLNKLRELGVEPYPHKYEPSHKSIEIISNFNELEKQTVCVAGRIMALRKMGKASFIQLKDNQGEIQIFIKKDNVGEHVYDVFNLMDIGDFIGINGFVFKSEDQDSLFNKLDNIFSEKYDMKQINLNANLKIKNEFDWTNIGRLTKKAYQSL